MPLLLWASKRPPQPVPASLEVKSLVYPHGNGYPDAPPQNRLILGDNLEVMSALLPTYEGCIDLIYADPPFLTNRRYAARIGRDEDSRRPREWQLAEGYGDYWESIEDYLDMLYPRLYLMYRLLSNTGTLYLHLDWHANHYARLLLDEIFGADRLLNEIIWVYHGPSPIQSAFNRKHDTILVYTKGETYTFNVDAVREPYDPSTVATFKSSPKAGFGKVPNLERGKVPEDWWYFPVVARLHKERTGYPTQKPEGLLQRIILASSNPGDLVADFFCGSGTTAVVAARCGRRFIVNDSAWRAIHITRARLVQQLSQPFTIEATFAHVKNSEEDEDIETLFIENPTPPLLYDSDTIYVANEELLAGLDYWEVDPCWDGRVFRSAVQSVRPRRKRLIANHLAIPGVSSRCPICVHLVFANGGEKWFVLKKRTP